MSTVAGTERPERGRQLQGTSWSPDREDIIALLEGCEIGDCSLVPRSSNYTFLAALRDGADGTSFGVYKPRRGEAPLHDFADGTLYLREHAAYLLSELLGWRMVPPTVIRDGPHGPGSLQLYIESVRGAHYFTFGPERPADGQRVALFDVVANNADRKSGHCLLGLDGRIWLIDNGLTFHSVTKLRTVIWEFSGRPIPKKLLVALARLRECLVSSSEAMAQRLRDLLSAREWEALVLRLDSLLTNPEYPEPPPYRCVPWPPI